MNPVVVRGIAIGTGIPKTIVPIVAHTESEALSAARTIAELHPDFAEWRVDWLTACTDDAVTVLLPKIKAVLAGIPLLVTFRSKNEGGEAELSSAEYERLCCAICDARADMIDVELCAGEAAVRRIAAYAHAAGVVTVASSHNFTTTPPRAEMVRILCAMQKLSADIAKLAVMPQNRRDVSALLAATAEMAELHPETPVITMSMGALGQISRICGETFGSAMTFASAGQASAPGQLPLAQLNRLLGALHTD